MTARQKRRLRKFYKHIPGGNKLAKKKQNFEEALLKLEGIVEKMENPQTGIDDLVSYYKEATELSVFLSESLSGYEKEVTELAKANEGFKEKLFGGEISDEF
jgi:exodeoxyribonuclease VII small subunit